VCEASSQTHFGALIKKRCFYRKAVVKFGYSFILSFVERERERDRHTERERERERFDRLRRKARDCFLRKFSCEKMGNSQKKRGTGRRPSMRGFSMDMPSDMSGEMRSSISVAMDDESNIFVCKYDIFGGADPAKSDFLAVYKAGDELDKFVWKTAVAGGRKGKETTGYSLLDIISDNEHVKYVVRYVSVVNHAMVMRCESDPFTLPTRPKSMILEETEIKSEDDEVPQSHSIPTQRRV